VLEIILTRPLPLAPVGLLVAVLAVYLATASWSVVSLDAHVTAVQSWQLAQHGTLALDGWTGTFSELLFEADGRVVSNRLPGAVLLAVPLYRLLGSPEAFSVAPSSLAAALSVAGAAALLLVALRPLAPPRVALAAAGLFAFGTCAWSVAADALWQHGPAVLALVAAVLALSRERWGLAGLALGVAVLCRPHLGVVAAVVVVWLLPRWRTAAAVAAGAGVGTAAFLAYQRLLYGRWTVLGGYGDGWIGWGGYGPGPFLHNVAGTLVSPQRGLLVYTPVLLVLLPGVAAAWRVAPGWVRASAAGGLAYTAVQLALNRFSGGWGFYGYRLVLEALAMCAPLLLLAWQHWTSATAGRRATFWALAALSVAVQVVGAVMPFPPVMDRPWLDNDLVHLIGPAGAGAVLVATAALWLALLAATRTRAGTDVPTAYEVAPRLPG
jgi:hypothetical protein